MLFVCDVCRDAVKPRNLSGETLMRARRVGKGKMFQGLVLLKDNEIICRECAEYLNLLEDNDKDGLRPPYKVHPWYKLEFPDKCERRADLDALRQSY